MQFLLAGKVWRSRTIAYLNAFYERRVKAGQGYTLADMAIVIFYVSCHQYERGQALAVTGMNDMPR